MKAVDFLLSEIDRYGCLYGSDGAVQDLIAKRSEVVIDAPVPDNTQETHDER